MKSIDESSSLEIVFHCLGKVWEPAGKAFKVQQELGIHSLEETPIAMDRAGYEICHVDLPEKVSGFAEIIADKPHVVLNRAKSPQNLQYTLPHELGHLILHRNPGREADSLGFPGASQAELEADLFATSWLLFLRDNKQRNDVLLRNPESSKTLASYFFLSIAIVLFAFLATFMSRDVPETR